MFRKECTCELTHSAKRNDLFFRVVVVVAGVCPCDAYHLTPLPFPSSTHTHRTFIHRDKRKQRRWGHHTRSVSPTFLLIALHSSSTQQSQHRVSFIVHSPEVACIACYHVFMKTQTAVSSPPPHREEQFRRVTKWLNVPLARKDTYYILSRKW